MQSGGVGYGRLVLMFEVFFPLFPCAACPSGRFGQGCQMKCVCENNARCDPVSGRCTCAPGWTGHNCRKGNSNEEHKLSLQSQTCIYNTWCMRYTPLCVACDAGHWGADCAESCNCRNGDGSCDAVTGQCNCEAGFTGTHCHQSMLLSACVPCDKVIHYVFTCQNGVRLQTVMMEEQNNIIYQHYFGLK